jgi:hypothetical protein
MRGRALPLVASRDQTPHQLIFYRCGASVTARWAAIHRTATVGDPVINRGMSVGDAIMVAANAGKAVPISVNSVPRSSIRVIIIVALSRTITFKRDISNSL